MKSVLCFVMFFVMGIALPETSEAEAQRVEQARREKAPAPAAEQTSEEVAIKIPQLAVTAAPQGQTPLNNAFALSEEIGNLQTKLQTLERQIENHKKDAHEAGTQRDYRKRNAYQAAAEEAKVKAQEIRDQIERKKSERHAKVEEVRRLGSSADSNVADAINLNAIVRDETMGTAMRRMDPMKVRGVGGAQIPDELLPLFGEFESDEAAMRAMSKDARAIEALSKKDMEDSLFMEAMRTAGQSLQQNRVGLENRFRDVSKTIAQEEKKKAASNEAERREIENKLTRK